MKWIKKNKIIVPIILVVIVLVGVGSLLMFGKGKVVAPQALDVSEKPVKKINADDIGLSLVPRSDKKAIILQISKLDGISALEYEVTYDAKVTDTTGDEQEGTTQRGVVGSPIDVKAGDSEIKRTIELGTCSRNICKYDNVVSAVKFVIKVTYSNGDVGSVEEDITP